MVIHSKLLQASVLGFLGLVGGMNCASAMQAEGQYNQPAKPKQVVVITESSSTTLTPEQFIELKTRANSLVEKEQELLAAIQHAKNPGVVATLGKTLCHVVSEIFSLAKTGVVSTAVAVSVGLAGLGAVADKRALVLDPKGFIIRLFGKEFLNYIAQTPWYSQIS